ncbi:hypothetical protein ACWGDS_16595 [Streptomyces sp. NPDC055059]
MAHNRVLRAPRLGLLGDPARVPRPPPRLGPGQDPRAGGEQRPGGLLGGAARRANAASSSSPGSRWPVRALCRALREMRPATAGEAAS